LEDGRGGVRTPGIWIEPCGHYRYPAIKCTLGFRFQGKKQLEMVARAFITADPDRKERRPSKDPKEIIF
jgi:hypothetical protein